MAMPLPLTCTIRSGRRLRIVSTSLSTMSAATAGIRPRQTHNFSTFVSDSQCIVREIDARYGAKPLIGVLHSISALVALLHQLQAEEEEEGGFAALVLLDVPVCPPGRTVDDNVEIGEAMAERARQRKIRFDSREDFVVSASRSHLFQRFRPAAIDARPDYATPRRGRRIRVALSARTRSAMRVLLRLGDAGVRRDRTRGPFCPVKAIGADPTLPFAYARHMPRYAFHAGL